MTLKNQGGCQITIFFKRTQTQICSNLEDYLPLKPDPCLSQKQTVFMPQWLPVSLAYLSCSWKWFGPAADQPQRAMKAGENFDNDFDSDIFSTVYSRLGCKVFSSGIWMDTYQSSLKQSTVLSAFKGYLVECPFLTTNSTMNYHSDAWLPASC